MTIWARDRDFKPPEKQTGEPKSKGWRTPYGFGDFTTPITYQEACDLMKPIYENFMKETEND
jgi:hypothetical protein